MREMVHAFGIIVARIEFGRAEGYLRFAVLAGEAGRAAARVALHAVDAGGIVLALVLVAIVDVGLAAGTRVAGNAFAAEAALLEHGAGGIVAAWIAEACVNHEFAMLAVVARLARAIVLALGQRHADAVILAWERVAGVTFRQNLIAHLVLAHEIVRWRRQQQFVVHCLRIRAACNARLNIIQFHPIG